MKIEVIGAGPGGLYFSLLVKKRNPNFEICVHERNPLDATFGFGVALQNSSWEYLAADDSECLQDILAVSTPISGQKITHRGVTIDFKSALPNAGIERMALLKVLRKHAEKAGVKLEHKSPIGTLDDLKGADLIVGADGVNSLVRNSLEREFGVTNRILSSRMAWYGTSIPFLSSRLTFKKTPYGYFWSVGYAHSKERSTFVAECEERAWKASGLAEMSPEEQVSFSEKIFADELNGARILSNNSAWKPLSVTRVQEWSVGKCVLIGDALHSPHPSIGSGTRLSMGDASALAESLSENSANLTKALEEFRAKREPSKMKLVIPMDRSLEWYETIGSRLDQLSPLELVYDYMSRTGRMSLEKMRIAAPEFYKQYGEQLERIAADKLSA